MPMPQEENAPFTEDELRELLTEDPDDFEANAFLGALLVTKNKPAEAEDHLRKALAADPDNIFSLTALADCLILLRRHTEAEMCIKRLIMANPGDPALLSSLGRCLIYQEKHAEAAEYLETAVQMQPENVSNLFMLGACLNNCELFMEARMYLERARALQPGSHEIARALEMCEEGLRSGQKKKETAFFCATCGKPVGYHHGHVPKKFERLPDSRVVCMDCYARMVAGGYNAPSV